MVPPLAIPTHDIDREAALTTSIHDCRPFVTSELGVDGRCPTEQPNGTMESCRD